MHPEHEHLAGLDRIDRALEASERARAKAMADLEAGKAALDEARRHADSLQDELVKSRDAQHEAERQAKRYRDRLKSANTVLESGIGDFQVAERQIEECSRILDDLETRILEQMELQDDLVARMRAAEGGIKRAREALDSLEERTPEILAEQRANEQALAAEREVHWAAIGEDFQDRYARNVARKKRPVATLQGDSCSGCLQLVQPQQRIELRRGRLVECTNCNRWLVLPE